MASRITILMVDDHPLFRQGLRHSVETDGRFEVIGEAGDGPTALRLLEESRPDVAVLDINLPGLSGLDLAREVRAKRLPTRLVILTMHKEEDLFNLALDLGVSGFVLKENAATDIVNCLAAVAAGEHYLSPSISGYLVRRRQHASDLAKRKPGIDDLTRAERRVLKLIADQKTSREIASELFISPRTVEAHRAHISAKLELRGAHSLLRFALENRAAI